MEMVVELFNEDHLAHPHILHVFVVPRLMTHLWRKQLSKDADVTFTVKAGSSFWPCSMHEPLTVLIVLPLVHIQQYSGPWKQRGGKTANELEDLLEAGFKHPGKHGCGNFHDLERTMPCVKNSPEKCSGALLFKFLEEQRAPPPVFGGVVQEMLSSPSRGNVPSTSQVR